MSAEPDETPPANDPPPTAPAMAKPQFKFNEDDFASQKKVYDKITLTPADFKALNTAAANFVAANSTECKKIPRQWKKTGWKDLAVRFVEKEGNGKKFWSTKRDEYVTSESLTYPDDKDSITFLAFILLRIQAQKHFSKRGAGASAANAEPEPKKAKVSESGTKSSGKAVAQVEGQESDVDDEDGNESESASSGVEDETETSSVKPKDDPFTTARETLSYMGKRDRSSTALPDQSSNVHMPTASSQHKGTPSEQGNSSQSGRSAARPGYSSQPSVVVPASQFKPINKPHNKLHTLAPKPLRAGGEYTEANTSTQASASVSPEFVHPGAGARLGPSPLPNFDDNGYEGMDMLGFGAGTARTSAPNGHDTAQAYRPATPPFTRAWPGMPPSLPTPISAMAQNATPSGSNALFNVSAGIARNQASQIMSAPTSESFKSFFGSAMLQCGSDSSQLGLAGASVCKVSFAGVFHPMQFRIRDDNAEAMWKGLMKKVGGALVEKPELESEMVDVEFS